MALNKIRKANKKARREQKRSKVRLEIGRRRQDSRVRQKRARAMFEQGRREFQAKRRAEKDYVNDLAAELGDEK